MRQFRTNHQTPHARWADWLDTIGADEAQAAAIYEALDVLHTGMQDLRDQVRAGDLTREEARDAATVSRAEFDEALQSILTEEQYAALLELRPDCNARREGRN